MILETNEVVLEVGKRLLDLDHIAEICRSDTNGVPSNHPQPWSPKSPSSGIASLVMLFSEIDNAHPGEGWDKAAHQLIKHLVELIQKEGIFGISMFAGLAGINHSVWCASKKGSRYQSLRGGLNEALNKRIEIEYFEAWDKGEFLAGSSWDVISGLSGLASYMLVLPEGDVGRFHLKGVIGRLCDLVLTEIEFNGFMMPRFFIPSELMPTDDKREKLAPGCVDTGVAHGIAGVLIVLARALGIDARCREAVEKLVAWFREHQVNGEWTTAYILSEEGELKASGGKGRDGWCYGSPGIGRALFIAADKLGDRSLKEESLNLFDRVIKRLPEGSGLACPTICHGWSGLLAIFHAMHIDSGLDYFATAAATARSKVLDRYDESHPFCFKSLVSVPSAEAFWNDNPGIIEGASGVALALLYSEARTHQPWLELFLI